MGAITGEIACSGAGNILVATLPRPRSNWIKNDVVERIKAATEVNVETMEVDLPVYVAIESPDLVPANTIVPSLKDLHTFVKERVTDHVSPLDGRGRIEIHVTEAPEAVAATLRRKIAKHRVGRNGPSWAGVVVTTDALAGVP